VTHLVLVTQLNLKGSNVGNNIEYVRVHLLVGVHLPI